MQPNLKIIASFRAIAHDKHLFDRALPKVEAAYAGLIRPDHHIWKYCLPLGQFTTADGERIDLGLHHDHDMSGERAPGRYTFSCGNVWGDEDSEYSSGLLDVFSRIAKPTTWRAIQFGLVKAEWFERDLFNYDEMFKLWCNSSLSGYDLEQQLRATQHTSHTQHKLTLNQKTS